MRYIFLLTLLISHSEIVNAKNLIEGYKSYSFGDDIAKFKCNDKSQFYEMFVEAFPENYYPDFFEGYISRDEYLTETGRLIRRQVESCSSINKDDLSINGAKVFVVYDFYKSKLMKVSIYLDNINDFANVLSVLRVKYGKPLTPHRDNYYVWKDDQSNSIEFFDYKDSNGKDKARIIIKSKNIGQIKKDYDFYVMDQL